MTHFTLKQLQYFVAVVESHSIAEASRQLHIAQPSISVAVKTLEERFGQPFFIRHHAQGVSLTPGGRRFYEKAKALLQQAHQFEQDSRADNDRQAGAIALGCFEAAAPRYLPRLVAGFNARYPQIVFTLFEGDQHELVPGLHHGRFDLVLLYDLALDGAIGKVTLNAPHQPYALLPAAHPLARRSRVTLAELSKEPMILLDVAPSKDYFITVFREKGYSPHIAYRSPSLEMVRGMVGRGLGFSLLVTRPVSAITCDGGRVACVEIADVMADSPLIIAWLRTHPPTRPGRLFIDYCRRVQL